MELMETALVELSEPLDFTNLSPVSFFQGEEDLPWKRLCLFCALPDVHALQVERLPQGPAGMSGEVWRMKQIRSGLQCVFKVRSKSEYMRLAGSVLKISQREGLELVRVTECHFIGAQLHRRPSDCESLKLPMFSIRIWAVCTGQHYFAGDPAGFAY